MGDTRGMGNARDTGDLRDRGNRGEAVERVSATARASIARIFTRAAQSRLVRSQGDACVVEPGVAWAGADAHGRGGMDDKANHNADDNDNADADVVVLTISSVTFRLVLLLRFTHDQATRDYFTGDAAGRALRDALLETSNLCGGAINQALLAHYPDLGMSTPYVLAARCMPHLDALAPDHVAAFAVTLGDAVRLSATICVCANARVDFVVDTDAMVEESSGELEFF